jgi:C4-dicarboxylate-binding protein DctP
VVDGCENTPSNYWTQKFHEVQKHITNSGHAHLQYALITNTKFWNGLAPDMRSALAKAAKDATHYSNGIAKQENVDALAKIKASGKTTIHTLTPQQVAAWKTAFKPVYKEAQDKIGPIVGELLKEAGVSV